MSNRVYRNLDEIFAGEYEGMTYDEIEKVLSLFEHFGHFLFIFVTILLLFCHVHFGG